MTSFEKELELKVKQLLNLKKEKSKITRDNQSNIIGNKNEIEKLEQLATTLEKELVRINQRIKELKGIPVEESNLSAEELQKIIQQAVKTEIEKEYQKDVNKKEEKKLEKELILKNAIVKREMKHTIGSKNKKQSAEYTKDQNIKDYELLSVASTSKKEKTIDKNKKEKIIDIDEKELKIRYKLLASYWNVTHSNLLFKSAVIQDVVKTFTQTDFIELDYALSQLNTNQGIKRKKIGLDSEDFYLSFQVASGIKARIFYQLIPDDLDKKKMVITRIVKQHNLRYVE